MGMGGKAEMEAFLLERRRSQKTSLQRILRSPGDTSVCRLKLRHHQDRSCILMGTPRRLSLQKEEEWRSPVEESQTNRQTHFLTQRAERKERQAGLVRLMAKMKHAKEDSLRGWEMVVACSYMAMEGAGVGSERATEACEETRPKKVAATSYAKHLKTKLTWKVNIP